MYAILVMQLHYDPNYVLDDMEMYEAKVALKYGYYAYKDVWEANRLTAYITAQVNSKNRIDIRNFVEFPWERKGNEEKDTSISREQIEHLKMKANNYIISKKKNG